MVLALDLPLEAALSHEEIWKLPRLPLLMWARVQVSLGRSWLGAAAGTSLFRDWAERGGR